MKKVIAAALTVVLLFSATACKNVHDESGAQTGSDTAGSGAAAAAEETAQAALGAEEALSLLNCRENEDGTYYAVFRSFRCPEYRKCVLSIKVERNETCSLPWTFSVQKQVTK